MSKLRLSDHAKADLSDIWLYIAHDNYAAAEGFVASLLEKMDLLAQSPRLGRQRDELRTDVVWGCFSRSTAGWVNSPSEGGTSKQGYRHRPNSPTGYPPDWETGRLADWETGRLGDWPTGKLVDWQTARPANRRTLTHTAPI